MKIELKRIKKICYDEVLDKYWNDYEKEDNLVVNEEYLDKNSENILVDGNQVIVDLDVDRYYEILESDEFEFKYNREAKIGMLLHKEMVDINGHKIPNYIMHEKELWSYITLKYFHKLLIELKLDGKITYDKVKRFVFNDGTVTRTGLKFYWSMIDKIDSEADDEMSRVAFEFSDPVNAIYERTKMSLNPYVVKSFVEAIIKNGEKPELKRDPHRRTCPNYVSCYAGVNILDVYNYDELLDIMIQLQNEYFENNS